MDTDGHLHPDIQWRSLNLKLNHVQKILKDNELLNLKILTLILKLFRPPKAKVPHSVYITYYLHRDNSYYMDTFSHEA